MNVYSLYLPVVPGRRRMGCLREYQEGQDCERGCELSKDAALEISHFRVLVASERVKGRAQICANSDYVFRAYTLFHDYMMQDIR